VQIKVLPARYSRYIEQELERVQFEGKQDTFERAQPAARVPDVRLVPDHLYDAEAKGETVVLVVSPDDPVAEVVRRVAEILTAARRVQVVTHAA